MPSLLINANETELLRALLSSNVRFLVAGGHAVIFHGHLRPAKDLDLFVAPTEANPSNLISALGSVGVSHPNLTVDRLSQPYQQIRINGQFNTELLTTISGVSFEDAYSSCEYAQVGELKVPVLSLTHLLESKRSLGREQDTQDIQALEKKVAH